MSDLLAVILAAGQGTRMKSKLPKVLHRLAGQPMVDHVVAVARAAGATRVVVVVGHQAEKLRAHFANDGVELVEQVPQLGTGHALQRVLPLLAESLLSPTVLVLNGDAPLIEAETLLALVERHRLAEAEVSFLTAVVNEPRRLGRVVRTAGGSTCIVEWADATDEQRAIREVNAGVYCFQGDWLRTELPRLTLSPKGEYYLTELIGRSARIVTLESASLASCVGVDTRAKLADAEQILQDRLRQHWMSEGVTLIDPGSVFFDAASRLSADTIVYPHTIIEASDVGEGCLLGPGTRLSAARLGRDCVVRESVIESSILEEDVQIGPFSHLRPGSHVERGARLGNYVEVKNSRIGRDTQIHHFSYTGDADLGRRVNIGAGTVTCNYDSETRRKSRTIVGDGASLGSDTMLVAPVVIGANAVTGSGAVVTRNVPAGAVAVGVPARVVRQVSRPAANAGGDCAPVPTPADPAEGAP
ncbi:MAG: bifunctional UDP-N-acetylglucosamine diphosphorylase/glucosamine-1-phosphate N-acetyltransferase GlmU [Chloroflexota bacterium]